MFDLIVVSNRGDSVVGDSSQFVPTSCCFIQIYLADTLCRFCCLVCALCLCGISKVNPPPPCLASTTPRRPPSRPKVRLIASQGAGRPLPGGAPNAKPLESVVTCVPCLAFGLGPLGNLRGVVPNPDSREMPGPAHRSGDHRNPRGRPSGRLYQVEYAMECISNAPAALGPRHPPHPVPSLRGTVTVRRPFSGGANITANIRANHFRNCLMFTGNGLPGLIHKIAPPSLRTLRSVYTIGCTRRNLHDGLVPSREDVRGDPPVGWRGGGCWPRTGWSWRPRRRRRPNSWCVDTPPPRQTLKWRVRVAVGRKDQDPQLARIRPGSLLFPS